MTLEKARRAIQLSADKQGISVAQVRADIEAAIAAGMANQSPSIQARWKQIPRKGAVPTPEEFVAFVAEHGSRSPVQWENPS